MKAKFETRTWVPVVYLGRSVRKQEGGGGMIEGEGRKDVT